MGDGVQLRANFYETHEKYPGYAIAKYVIDEQYDPARDHRHLERAIRLCRATYGEAFQAGTLQRWDAHTHAEPFRPQFVVICLKNARDHTGEADFAASHRVAWVFPAADFFDSHKDVEDLLKVALVDREPFAYPPRRWLVIERHMAGNARTKSQTRPAPGDLAFSRPRGGGT